MARAATYNLTSKTARLRLRSRPKPYNSTLHAGLMLGYRRAKQGAGTWLRLQLIDPAAERYRQNQLGLADDLELADGVSILTFEQARAKALDRPPTRLTVKRAVELYLQNQRAAKGVQAHADAKQKLDKHVVPALGEFEVAALTKQRIEDWRAALVPEHDDEDALRRARDSANRNLSALKAVLNFTCADDQSDQAWRRVRAYKDVGASRQDHFDSAQFGKLLKAARAADPAFADLLEVAWLTGARYGELAACNVEHFDHRAGTLEIPSGKTGQRVVVLTKDATATLKRIAGKRPADAPLLARSGGGRWLKSLQHRPMKAALKKAKLPATASLYALRHSYVSRAIESSVPLNIIAANCGTSIQMIEKSYAKHLDKMRRELLERASPALRVKRK